MDSSPQTDGFIASTDGLITFITSPDPAGSRKDPTGSGGGCSADQAMPRESTRPPTAPPSGRDQCSRGAGTTRSTSG
jgi:hypothetical protein